MDEGGNLWVAGGADGLFLMKNNGTAAAPQLSGSFQKFGLADGLHPYGYLNGDVAKFYGKPDGSPADPSPSLTATPVISVAGGPAGTVFVGYQGKVGCESEWNWQCDVLNPNGSCAQPTPPSTWGNPAIYKSGDADRVTLAGNGITVVHYDIFSGPNVVGDEPGGREKICSVLRLSYDKANGLVWFGGNHGFAVGLADAPGNPTCNGEYPGGFNTGPSAINCANVWEHSHPAVSGCSVDSTSNGYCGTGGHTLWLTDAYYGISKDLQTGDVWFGGQNRSTVYHFGSYRSLGLNPLTAYYAAEADTEFRRLPGATDALQYGLCSSMGPRPDNQAHVKGISCGYENRLDIWKDPKPECTSTTGDPTHCTTNYVGPGDRNDDAVSAIAAIGGGQAWLSSFAHGLVLIDAYGNVMADVTARLLGPNVSSLALDPSDSTLWAGMAWGLGISRYDPKTNNMTQYSSQTFGAKLASSPIANIQPWVLPGTAPTTTPPARRMVVGFGRNGTLAGAVGIFDK